MPGRSVPGVAVAQGQSLETRAQAFGGPQGKGAWP